MSPQPYQKFDQLNVDFTKFFRTTNVSLKSDGLGASKTKHSINLIRPPFGVSEICRQNRKY